MANRKKTPDILGDLLGGGRLPKSQSKTKVTEGEQAELPIPENNKPASRKKTGKSKRLMLSILRACSIEGQVPWSL